VRVLHAAQAGTHLRQDGAAVILKLFLWACLFADLLLLAILLMALRVVWWLIKEN
jgi:hypothetical protein